MTITEKASESERAQIVDELLDQLTKEPPRGVMPPWRSPEGPVTNFLWVGVAIRLETHLAESECV
jgi:hypothetical protein